MNILCIHDYDKNNNQSKTHHEFLKQNLSFENRYIAGPDITVN